MSDGKINISTLNAKELDTILLASVPTLRRIYERSNDLKQTIHGFRASTIPQYLLINRAKNSIQTDKNYFLIKTLNSYFDCLRKDVDEEKTKLVGEGKNDEEALLAAIKKQKISANMVPVFLKMIGANPEILEKWREKDDIRKFIKDEIAKQVPKARQEKPAVEKDKAQSRQIVALSKAIQSLSERIDSLENNQKREEKENQYGEIKEDIKNTNERFDKLSLSLKRPQKTQTPAKQIQESPNKELDKLLLRIEKLEQDQKAFLHPANGVSSLDVQSKKSIFVEEIQAHDYSVDQGGEYFFQDIEDVAEDLVGKASFNAFCGFLAECFYSGKFIFSSKDNANSLAVALASIISGGRLVRLSADTNFTNSDLLEAIKNKVTKDGKTVFLIDGALGNFNLQITLSGIEKEFINEGIFVFSVPDDRSVKFIPVEIIKDFMFFSASIKNVEPQYRYLGIVPNKGRFGNDGLKYFLRNVGFEFAYNGITGTDDASNINDIVSGLICFSYLPFVCLHDGKEKDDVLSKIDNPTMKTICEGILK
ncbi:MAG: hypothetical protein LKG11_06065 [Bacilli bacterium]|jgi:hypothetical protein|nr:hypothetical protein [Bacilli bacterium]